MTKGINLIGHFMNKFYEESTDPKFNLFAEIVLAIRNLSDEEFDRLIQD